MCVRAWLLLLLAFLLSLPPSLRPCLPASLPTIIIRVDDRRQVKARPLEQAEHQQHIGSHGVHPDEKWVSLLPLAGDVFSRFVQQGRVAQGEGEEVREDDARDDDQDGVAL